MQVVDILYCLCLLCYIAGFLILLVVLVKVSQIHKVFPKCVSCIYTGVLILSRILWPIWRQRNPAKPWHIKLETLKDI